MGWATHYIQKLKVGETVQFRPRGSSMKGRVESGQLVTVEPIKDYALLEVGDIVLCKVGAAEYLHLIKSIIRPGEMFMIGNNRGHTNGQAGAGRIFGKCVRVED